MSKKIFTPQEANRRLPLIKKIVADILEKGQEAKKLLDQIQDEAIQKKIYALQEEIEKLMEELEELGCYFKDWNFEIGLVDFPALIDGDAVLLCWRSDEPDIRWYHGFEEGFSGRKQIPDGLLINEG